MIDRFNELIKPLNKGGLRLNQHIPEWRAFIEYIYGYFKIRNISHPLVVEIGILDGAQRQFYENFLNAEYVGVDINSTTPADIVGDSTSLSTAIALDRMLGQRRIDLLFIDGLHTYEAVKSDYEVYGPMTKHIIALHDIHTLCLVPGEGIDVRRLWDEIIATNETDTLITIQAHNDQDPRRFNGRQLGIGLVVKGGRL